MNPAMDMNGSWYSYLDTNLYLAALIVVLTGMGFAISLSVRSLIRQLVCKALVAVDIQTPSLTCSTEDLTVSALEFVFVLIIVLLSGLVLLKAFQLKLRTHIEHLQSHPL